MNQQELLKKTQELLKELEGDFKKSDAELMDLEARKEYKGLELAALEDRSVEVHDEQREIGEDCDKKLTEKLILQESVNMLRDYEGFVGGILFRNSAEGAMFFTMSLSEFAYSVGMGEMSLEEELGKSTDDFSVEIEGEKYCYLKSWDGNYYFHPLQIKGDLLCGKLLMVT